MNKLKKLEKKLGQAKKAAWASGDFSEVYRLDREMDEVVSQMAIEHWPQISDGQSVRASSYYAADARRVESVEEALDVGPEGSLPTRFWVIDQTALDALTDYIESAKTAALEAKASGEYYGIDVEYRKASASAADFAGPFDDSVSARAIVKDEPSWLDFIIREIDLREV